MAKANGWGYRRILGEFRKLGIHSIFRSTVARILQENGFEPSPQRGGGTWHEFLRQPVKTLWATDFFTKTVWTLRGPMTYHTLKAQTDAPLHPPEPLVDFSLDDVGGHESLSGLGKYYERGAWEAARVLVSNRSSV